MSQVLEDARARGAVRSSSWPDRASRGRWRKESRARSWPPRPMTQAAAVGAAALLDRAVPGLHEHRPLWAWRSAPSLKNVVALASGILDGLELGQNARGALLTRGLAEIRRLGEAIGARAGDVPRAGRGGRPGDDLHQPAEPEPHAGGGAGAGRAAGVGDGADRDGRRRRADHAGGGRRWPAGSAWRCRSRQQVHRILFEGVPPAVALRELMTRPLKAE